MTPSGRHARKLRRLIDELNPDILPSVVHLARSLDDPDVVDSLLEGTTWKKRRLELGNTLCRGPRRTHHHMRVAALALIATGIGPRARALREQIDRLDLAHYDSDSFDPPTPIDVELLVGLPLRASLRRHTG